MSEQARLRVGMGLPRLGGCWRGFQAAPAALSQAGGDALAPAFPRSPQGMLSRGLPDLCAAVLSEHLRQRYILLAL